ncbi:MAG TPA: DUF3108 domain-containing protein [Azospirillaceae bacterium]|nr:DUF3108 domain-containing protein [Azospirillaceae bacterium]
MRAFPVLAVLVTVLLPIGSARARAEGMRLDYNVYVGGVSAAAVSFELRTDGRRFATASSVKTHGMIGFLFPWESRSEADGRVDAQRGGHAYLPARNTVASSWNGKARTLVALYDNAGTIVKVEETPPETDPREPVPSDLRRGTTDLVSGIMGLLDRIAAGGACNGKLPVFDGKRRFDVHLADAGMAHLKANRWSAFQGDARHCVLRFKTLAGKPVGGERTRFWKTVDAQGFQGWPMSVHIAPAGPGGRQIPVRLETDGPLGTILVNLASVQVPAGSAAQAAR